MAPPLAPAAAALAAASFWAFAAAAAYETQLCQLERVPNPVRVGAACASRTQHSDQAQIQHQSLTVIDTAAPGRRA